MDGFTLGGMARGMQNRRASDLADRQVGLQEKQFNSSQAATARAQALERIQITSGQLKTTIESLQAAGKSRQEIGAAVEPLVQDLRDLAPHAQIPPDVLTAGALSLIEKPTEAELAVQTGENEVAATSAQIAAISELPLEQRQVVAQKLGFIDTPSQTEFFTLMSELESIQMGVLEGTADASDPIISQRIDLLNARLDKLTAETKSPLEGLNLKVSEDGNVTLSFGGEETAVAGDFAIPASKLADLRATNDQIEMGVSLVDTLLAEIESDPSKFGIVGTARRAKEIAGGMLSDIAAAGLSVFGDSVEDAVSAFDSIVEFEQGARTSQVVIDSVKPKTTGATDVMAAQLKYAVARSMQPTGKLLASTVEAAREMTDITGLTSKDRVRDKLVQIKSQLETSKSDIVSQMQQGVSGAADAPEEEPLVKPDDLNKAIDEMTAEELGQLDTAQMTATELRAAAKRWEELNE